MEIEWTRCYSQCDTRQLDRLRDALADNHPWHINSSGVKMFKWRTELLLTQSCMNSICANKVHKSLNHEETWSSDSCRGTSLIKTDTSADTMHAVEPQHWTHWQVKWISLNIRLQCSVLLGNPGSRCHTTHASHPNRRCGPSAPPHANWTPRWQRPKMTSSWSDQQQRKFASAHACLTWNKW